MAAPNGTTLQLLWMMKRRFQKTKIADTIRSPVLRYLLFMDSQLRRQAGSTGSLLRKLTQHVAIALHNLSRHRHLPFELRIIWC